MQVESQAEVWDPMHQAGHGYEVGTTHHQHSHGGLSLIPMTLGELKWYGYIRQLTASVVHFGSCFNVVLVNK